MNKTISWFLERSILVVWLSSEDDSEKLSAYLFIYSSSLIWYLALTRLCTYIELYYAKSKLSTHRHKHKHKWQKQTLLINSRTYANGKVISKTCISVFCLPLWQSKHCKIQSFGDWATQMKATNKENRKLVYGIRLTTEIKSQ